MHSTVALDSRSFFRSVIGFEWSSQSVLGTRWRDDCSFSYDDDLQAELQVSLHLGDLRTLALLGETVQVACGQ